MLEEQIGVGNGGWVHYVASDLRVQVFLRFADRGGRLEVFDLALVTVDGEERPIDSTLLRSLPLAHVEAYVNSAMADEVRTRLELPEVVRSGLASYATGFGGKRRGENGYEVLWSLLPKNPSFASVPAPSEPRREEVDASLVVPEAARYEDEFYKSVADVYSALVRNGSRAPAAAIADANGIQITNAHRWVRRARELGFLPPARHGKAG